MEIIEAAKDEDYELLEHLLYYDPLLVNYRDKYQMTALHWAALRGYDEIVRLLLEYEADIEVKDLYGMTPLHWASKHGNMDSAVLCLQYGANMLDKDSNGWLPVQYAENNEQWEMVEFLRSKTMEAIERLSTLSSSSAAAVEEEDTTTIENIFSFPSTAKHLSSNIDSNSFTVFSFDTLHSCLDMMLQDEENLQYDTELTNYTKYRATRVDDLGTEMDMEELHESSSQLLM